MKTLELMVSVSLDGTNFEDKPCMLVFNNAEGRLVREAACLWSKVES